MKKFFSLMLSVLLLCLCGCSLFSASDDDEPFSAEYTIRTTAKPTEVFFDIPYSEALSTETATQILRSDALSFSDLRSLFLESYFPDESSTVRMWKSQIRYCLEGNYTATDSNKLSEISRDLIGVSGFPGIRESTRSDANVFIRFSSEEKASVSIDADNAGVLHGGTILVPDNFTADERKAFLELSFMQLCGFSNSVQTPLDTVLNKDDPADALTEIDLILLDIIYGEMQPGISRDACMHVFDAYFKNNG